MNSVLLQLAAPYVTRLLLLFALITLFRGHNAPGGGFIGGLLAALAVVYQALAYYPAKALEALPLRPTRIMALGLLFALLSMLPGLFLHDAWMAAVWLKWQVPLLGEIKAGTILLFDLGVFFTVIGVTLVFLFSLIKK